MFHTGLESPGRFFDLTTRRIHVRAVGGPDLECNAPAQELPWNARETGVMSNRWPAPHLSEGRGPLILFSHVM